MQVICEHPNIILNPSLPTLICKYKVVYLGSEVIRFRSNLRYMVHLDKRKFYEVMQYVNQDNIDDFSVVDESTGERFPVFLCVPCGHCDICKNRKINSFVQRCRLESQVYDCKPWFITLTYSDNYLPSVGVSVRDAQLFMKRFRVNLTRHGFFKPIRYCLCAEYGKNTHRAHYHAIIWNLSPNTFLDYSSIVRIIEDSWQCGFVTCRVVDPSDDKTFYYTAKYLKKDCVVPSGCNDTFMLSSRKDGGIGAPFIDSIKNRLRNSLNHQFQYLDKWSNKVQKLRFDSYILNRVFPSYCSSFPAALRVHSLQFKYYFDAFSKTDDNLTFLFSKTKDYVDSLFNSVVYCPRGKFSVSAKDITSDSSNFGRLYQLEKSIQRFALSPSELEKTSRQAEENQRKRDLFVSKCFRDMQPVDIAALGYSVRNRFSRSKSLEIL